MGHFVIIKMHHKDKRYDYYHLNLPHILLEYLESIIITQQ